MLMTTAANAAVNDNNCDFSSKWSSNLNINEKTIVKTRSTLHRPVRQQSGDGFGAEVSTVPDNSTDNGDSDNEHVRCAVAS